MRLLGGALVVGGLLTLCCLMLARGRRRHRAPGQRRQPSVPPAPPHDLDTTDAIMGVYVATTTAYDWTDRITVHGLDIRSRAAVVVDPDGVTILRSAAPSFFIPAGDLLTVRLARDAEATGLVVLTWQHQGHRLDTGFRPRLTADAKLLVELCHELTQPGPDPEPQPEDHEELHHVNGDTR